MSLTILYVEDNQIVADAVRDLLEAEGWSVEACADGYCAVERLADGRSYDLLLFDHDLPGVSGMELTRHARRLARHGRTPIIILSAGAHEAEARHAGANLFLSKPEGITGLVDAVRRLTG
jgi:CheY-like chemotaxis protein